MQEEFKNRQENRKESFAQLKELNKAQNEEVKTILYEEQYRNYIELKRQNLAKLRQQQTEKRTDIKNSRQNRIETLNLSETQKTELRVIKM